MIEPELLTEEEMIKQMAGYNNGTTNYTVNPPKNFADKDMLTTFKDTNIVINMFDFMAVIFWVIFATCFATILVAFRNEISIVCKRIM